MAHLYMAMHMLVKELHQFARIEAILLTQIDEELAIRTP
jgi:hypothetical protein